LEAGGIEPPLQIERNENSEKSCVNCTECRAARALHFGGTGSQFLAWNDADLQFIAHAWEQIPEAVRTAITMLVKANVSNAPDVELVAEERRKSREALAMRLAQDCRYIIQGCLREEEWQDADQEFFEVIAPHV
jgi:hypothetical protein